jgi:hypothetical protein
LGGMDAEVRRGIRGWCGGGHDGDYTATRGSEEVQLLISRLGRRSVNGLITF